jgi:cytochrome P450
MSALLTFVLAMIRYPSAQLKAQEELDRVVGPDRLPDFKDSPNLPYLNALLREVMRWRPTAPVGESWCIHVLRIPLILITLTALPHMTCENDICDGYFIPKGSIVIPNIWYAL